MERLAHQEPPSKKAKTSDGKFAGVKVLFVQSSIQHSVSRIKHWTASLGKQGGRVAQESKEKGITHLIVGEVQRPSDLAVNKKQVVVSTAWLEDSLAAAEKLSTQKYLLNLPAVSESDVPPWPEPTSTSSSKLNRFERWLGHWKPEYDDFKDLLEVVLQAKFTDGLPDNQPIAKALGLLCKYEGALAADYNSKKKASLGNESFNRRALTYAKAVAVVRACAFPITKELQEGQIPFVGGGTVRRIHDILATGTTEDIEAHQHGREIKDTEGHVRGVDAGNAVRGGAAKYEFIRLPGVGQATAEAWYDLGLRTLEDVEAAVKEGGALGPKRLTFEQKWSLQHRHDLLAECSEADVQEMRAATLSVLDELAGTGWIMELAGGARRGKASHDADFLVSHPQKAKAGMLRAVVERLIKQGKVLPANQGFCRIQDGRAPADERRTTKHNNIAEDRFDRLLGIFLTAAGHIRRMDLIFVPWEEWGFALLGWTGSQQYLRFLRGHADTCGMRLNSHKYKVPSEGPPQNRKKLPVWPPGWHRQRRVESEADIFELLGLPYREPNERKA